MTIRQALILVVAVLVGTVLTPIGYTPAAVVLLGTAAYGLHAFLKRLNTRVPDRTIAAFVLGIFLFALVAWVEFVRRVA